MLSRCGRPLLHVLGPSFPLLTCRPFVSCPPRLMKPLVVFVLGGPGAGKGTQCARIVEVRPGQLTLARGCDRIPGPCVPPRPPRGPAVSASGDRRAVVRVAGGLGSAGAWHVGTGSSRSSASGTPAAEGDRGGRFVPTPRASAPFGHPRSSGEWPGGRTCRRVRPPGTPERAEGSASLAGLWVRAEQQGCGCEGARALGWAPAPPARPVPQPSKSRSLGLSVRCPRKEPRGDMCVGDPSCASSPGPGQPPGAEVPRGRA